MYACDFEYDGKYLSDFGYIVCEFDGDGGLDTSNKGSEIEFTNVALHSGKKHYASGTKYNTCLSTTFHICRDPDIYGDEYAEISREDFRDLSRWLNRRGYYKFRAIDMFEPNTPQPYFYGTFNLSKVNVGGKTYGVELNMKTNSPFGYAPEKWFRYEFNSGEEKIFRDPSDEIGYTYPKVVITCKQGGTLVLTNNLTGCRTEIQNCETDEVITFSGETMIITSSVPTHDVANDFNYDFFSFGNTFNNRENIISSSLNCKFEMCYEAILKDAV